jgi:hypothetical protein
LDGVLAAVFRPARDSMIPFSFKGDTLDSGVTFAPRVDLSILADSEEREERLLGRVRDRSGVGLIGYLLGVVCMGTVSGVFDDTITASERPLADFSLFSSSH